MIDRRSFASAGLLMAAAAAPQLLASPALAQDKPESTFDRIKRTKKFRCAAVVGAEPYFSKNIATGEWSGLCYSMAKDLAELFEAQLEVVESTWGNSVLDLQAGKIDVSFGLNPTPKRALVVDFTRPLFSTAFCAVLRNGFEAATWADLNKPEVSIAVDIGSTHELIARRMAPKANIVGFKSPDEAVLAVQGGRANCFIMTAFLALAAKKKGKSLGKLIVPGPVLSAPGTAALRLDGDGRMRDFLNSWAEYNRGMGQVREWILASLGQMGITPEDIPAEVNF